MKIYQFIKRFLDVLVAIVALIILFPLLMVIGICIFILEGWPIFYISRRFVTKDMSISIMKFRTMVKDATAPRYRLNERFMRNGYLDIPLSCEVYTPIGRVLERTQMVEILQLINIVFHGMSLIGNRPLPASNIELLKAFPDWEKRFDSPAGITGISQIVGKLNIEPTERLALEVLYSKVYQEGNILLCDFLIAWHTITMILLGEVLPFDKARDILDKCLK